MQSNIILQGLLKRGTKATATKRLKSKRGARLAGMQSIFP
jgi:hypothetical protein